MNIALLHRRYDNTGGTERDLYHLVSQLLQLGHEIHLYCGEFRAPAQAGAVTHRVPFLRTGETAKLLSFASAAPRLAQAGRHDVIISFSKVLKQDIARCGGGTHRNYLEAMKRVRGPLKRALKWPKDRAALYIEGVQFRRENHRRVIAVSEIVKQELVALYRLPHHAIEVIYDGVDTTTFSPENRIRYRAPVRKEFAVGEADFLILFVGSGFARKGLEFLLEATAALNRPDVKLLVVGHDSHIERFRRSAARLGIGNAVIFAGLRKDAHRFYAAADLLALPSVQEAFGNVVLEALSSGLPVITTRNAGASEILEGKLRDYVLEQPDDVSAMARMMRDLMNRDLRDELSRLAVKKAAGYTFEANARAVEHVCEQVLLEKKRCKRL